MKARLEKLENTLMELGTELYILRSQISRLSDENERLLKSFEGLKRVFDDKDVITYEEFDLAVDLVSSVDTSDYDQDSEARAQPAKKMSH